MIKSFKDAATAAVFEGLVPRQLAQVAARAARKKLRLLDRAASLRDLRGAGLSLEALKDDRLGQHAIRASRQLRICFRWVDGHAEDVELTLHYR